MTFQPAHKDITNPPGQIVNRIESNVPPRAKTLGSIIDRIQREEGSINSVEQARQEGYAQGFVDGKKEGFAEGIAWVKGK